MARKATEISTLLKVQDHKFKSVAQIYDFMKENVYKLNQEQSVKFAPIDPQPYTSLTRHRDAWR